MDPIPTSDHGNIWGTLADVALGTTGATFWLWAGHLDMALNIILAASGVFLLLTRAFRNGRGR